jgi:GTPase
MKKLRKKHIFIKNEKEITACAKNMKSNTICPVFEVSNVTGKGLDGLKSFLFQLKERSI